MKKNKNLVLTGWSKPGYVAAAAAALEALGDASAILVGRYHIIRQLLQGGTCLKIV